MSDFLPNFTEKWLILLETDNEEFFLARLMSDKSGHKIRLRSVTNACLLYETETHEFVDDAERDMVQWMGKNYREFGVPHFDDDKIHQAIEAAIEESNG